MTRRIAAWLLVAAAVLLVANAAPHSRAASPAAVQFSLAAGPVLRVDCSVAGACSQTPEVNGTYAYAPADIDYQGAHHLFFCSAGEPNVSFDRIRYINDRDKELRIVLSVSGYNGRDGWDMAACDPEVIRFNGIFYMFYGSALALNPEDANKAKWHFTNVIHLARSAAIGGPYRILDEDGSWKPKTERPRHVIPPRAANLEHSQKRGYLGASWPSAVVRGNRVLLWYMDDISADVPQAQHAYFFVESDDPARWDSAAAVRTDIEDEPHSGEVKFDPASNRFVLFSVYGAHSAEAWLGTRDSADGVHWSAAEKIAKLPPFSHNLGVESDDQGQLPSGRFTFSFAAPIGLANDLSWARWNLYAGTLDRR